jgi:hypothetical protein
MISLLQFLISDGGYPTWEARSGEDPLFTDTLRTKKWIRHVAGTLPATINVSAR